MQNENIDMKEKIKNAKKIAQLVKLSKRTHRERYINLIISLLIL